MTAASERPDADSLTGYIVTYKSIPAAATQHHLFNQACNTLNKKKKVKILALTIWQNSKLKIISLPNPNYDKKKTSDISVVLTLLSLKNNWIIFLNKFVL